MNINELAETTQVERPDVEIRDPKKMSRRIALVLGSAPSMSEESTKRLAERLRLAALLIGSGFGVFFLLKLLNLFQSTVQPYPLLFWGHLLVALSTLGVGWRLCANCSIVLRHLRIAEWIVFGGPAIFFTILSHAILKNSIAEGYVADITPPWLLLMFTYALLIPNTWRRAAFVIVPMALLPLGTMFIARMTSENFIDVLRADPVFRAAVIKIFLTMIWGAATAIWGVFSIRSLRREAFEAKKMGQYQLKKLLGRGGMGEVYLAEHRMLKRPCALKLIRPEMADAGQNLARFEREVQSTARLTHWNTVEIYDYGNTDDGVFYYVMEYLPGMNLDEIVQMNGPLPVSRTIHLLKQVCDALAEAHCLGLVHRDIKPANIFAARRGGQYDVAKLLDFGLVRQSGFAGVADFDEDLTRDGAITGSPLYMSPEQALGETPEARSDIYSLGAVAYFLLTGRPPFRDENPMRVIMAHARDIPERPSKWNADISPALDSVVMKCLEKKPEDRYANVRDLRADLADCETAAGWTPEDSATWWKDHGCPHKKKLDAEVMELTSA
jgi:tRNA A-37 threonylcarbamoyl transferase component Bud32